LIQIINHQEPIEVIVPHQPSIQVFVPRSVGPPGPPGPPGPASQSVGGTYTHVQGVAESVWTITHNLGFYPNVSCFSNGDEIVGDIDHLDVNTTIISYAYAVSGSAYLS
jgi:hypothetical protein